MKVKTLYDALEFINNVQGYPKWDKCVPFYIRFYPNISKYFEVTS